MRQKNLCFEPPSPVMEILWLMAEGDVTMHAQEVLSELHPPLLATTDETRQ